MTVKFCEIDIGQQFEFRGRRYRKVALSMAHDEERWANIFQGHTEVMPARRPDEVPSKDVPRRGALA